MTLPNEPTGDLPKEIVWRVGLSAAMAAMAALHPDDRRVVFDWFILPKTARARQERRDQVIRHIWSKTDPNESDNARANAIAKTYDRYRVSARWNAFKNEPLPPDDQTDLERYYHQFARFNDAKRLGARRILVIVSY